jgi:hypothetical protein
MEVMVEEVLGVGMVFLDWVKIECHETSCMMHPVIVQHLDVSI